MSILDSIAAWMQIALYTAIIILGIVLVKQVGKKLIYWPVIRILACIEVGRSAYFGYGDTMFILGFNQDLLAFRKPPWSIAVLVAITGLLVYSNYLVRKQNGLDRKAEVGLSGTTRRKSSQELKVEVEEVARAGIEVALEERGERDDARAAEVLRKLGERKEKVA